MSSRHGFLGASSNSSSSGSNSSGGRRLRAGTSTLVTVFEAESGKQLDVELSESGHDGGGATEALRRRLYRCARDGSSSSGCVLCVLE